MVPQGVVSYDSTESHLRAIEYSVPKIDVIILPFNVTLLPEPVQKFSVITNDMHSSKWQHKWTEARKYL